ncbi:MAG: hypothetical protein Q7N50_10435 [Armatimonadota bacterium]|nr:hypothetical protein [Armatimonadota bacterium]
MKMPYPIIAAIIVSALAGLIALPRLLDSMGLRKKNFKGDMIPAAYGVQIAYFAVLGCAIIRVLDLSPARITMQYAVLIGGMAAFGFLDDAFGSRETGGFAGHFKKLLLERKLTTGAVKAIGGGALALALGWSVSKAAPDWIINSLLIALSANALNLVDLRPGRALAVFAIGLLAVTAACGFRLSGAWPLAALILPTAILAHKDVRGQAMMGDTGSNPLGAALGLTIAIDGPLSVKFTTIGLLIVLHLICERYSLSQIIERNPILRRIDSLLGVR